MHGSWNIIDRGGHIKDEYRKPRSRGFCFAGNDEHLELSGSHKPTSETSTQGMATISSPETTSDTNTKGLATISSPESTEQGNLQNSNREPAYKCSQFVCLE